MGENKEKLCEILSDKFPSLYMDEIEHVFDKTLSYTFDSTCLALELITKDIESGKLRVPGFNTFTELTPNKIMKKFSLSEFESRKFLSKGTEDYNPKRKYVKKR